MAVTATPIFPQTIKNSVVTIVNADASGAKTVYTAGTNGSKIESWIISSTDSVARDLQIFMVISATSYQMTTINIPINAGNTNAIVPVNILAHAQFPGLAKDSNGNPYIYLASGTSLTISSTTTVTSPKVIYSMIQGGDY